MADNTIYEIILDIVPVRMRPCRPYQEKISDYASDGRRRFEWETMRHNKLLRGDNTVDNICAECAINILQTAEGCKSAVFGLELFLKAAARLSPDSVWAGLTLEQENNFSVQKTMELAEDIIKLEKIFSENTWKVAQLWAYDEPVMEYFEDGSSRPRYFTWNGELQPFPIYSNEGYQIYLCSNGILVRSNFEDTSSHIYSKLVRDETGVFGMSKEGEKVVFKPVMARCPEWDKEDPRGYGELRFVDMNAADVFRDALDMLIVFTDVAHKAKTSFSLNVVM
ncbi:hypothetical protein IJT93_00430 [bacterium]|nr:hypothetical protein [bacterium]